MKQSKLIFLVLLLVLLNSSCNTVQNKPENTPSSARDASCQQTIQKLYSLETYCPSNLEALRQLYTENFLQQHQPSLDRCNDVSKYAIVRLLSQNDADFPSIYNPYPSSAPDALVYYAEVEIEMKSEGMPVGSPASLWLFMQADDSGGCKVDQISGGG
jgi:hypothetical protein